MKVTLGTVWVKHVNIDEMVWRKSESKRNGVKCGNQSNVGTMWMWGVVPTSLKAKNWNLFHWLFCNTCVNVLEWTLEEVWRTHFHCILISFHFITRAVIARDCVCSGSRMRWNWQCFTWALLSAATPSLSQLKRISTQTMTLLLNQLQDYSPFCQGKPG